MRALLPFAVGCAALIATPGSAGGQEPPRSALDALASLTPPRPVAPGRAGSDLQRALASADWPRAEQLLAEAIARAPRSTALLKQIAGVFLADRKPLNAAIALKKAEALEPLDNASRFQLVLAYVAMGQREWARPELERLAAAAPDTAIYRYWLGRLDYDAGRYAAAIVHLRAAAERDPSFARTFDNLGLCYEALDQVALAIPQYREAIRLTQLTAEPSPWPFVNLAAALARSGDYGEAEALLRQALRIDPRASRALYQLGTVLEATDRSGDAIATLSAAADADPTYPEPLYALARIYRRQGRTAEADAALAAFAGRRAASESGTRGAALKP
jgi:tetratricopeptide (TPR) repeat protein